MNTKSMKHTITPKSDQLNSEELIGKTMDITITKTTLTTSVEQPIIINFDGDNGKPYKPCKTMRKVLAAAWTEFHESWTGKSLRLFCDPEVKFGSEKVGGIRISHMSDIPSDRIELSLLATKGKKKLYTIQRMAAQSAPDYSAVREALEKAAKTDMSALVKEWEKCSPAAKKALESFKDDLKKKYSVTAAATATPTDGGF